MTTSAYISLYGTVADSIVDGPGLRYAVFVQGCSHKCRGCHNPESQPVEGGTLASIDDVVADIRANKLIKNVTISGGEPFEQPLACAQLACRLKELGYNVWVYSGYRYEDLLRMSCESSDWDSRAGSLAKGESDGNDDGVARAQAITRLLECADVLVDGPFVDSLKSLGLKWKGSSNQRVIDLPATRKAGRVVMWEAKESFPTKPSSW